MEASVLRPQRGGDVVALGHNVDRVAQLGDTLRRYQLRSAAGQHRLQSHPGIGYVLQGEPLELQHQRELLGELARAGSANGRAAAGSGTNDDEAPDLEQPKRLTEGGSPDLQ